MVVITLLSVIVLGLMAMFNQTQRAFRAGMTQVDVLEAGRMATHMVAREMEEMSPARQRGVNFYASLPTVSIILRQPLTGGTTSRQNVMEEVFFLTRENRQWIGIGYVVTNPDEGIGSLYRFQQILNVSQNPAVLYTNFVNTPVTNMSRILDGVVHFRVRAYNTNGVWMTENTTNFYANIYLTNANAGTWPQLSYPEVSHCRFESNALPASVEVELGILEPQIFEKYRSIPVSPANMEFLQEQAARVHIFRQRIPIRNVDPSAYK